MEKGPRSTGTPIPIATPRDKATLWSCFTNFQKQSLNPCHTRVASLQRSHSVYKNCRTPRCALCKRKQRCRNAVETLCKRLERHAAAFILSMLKTNAAAWRFHSVLYKCLNTKTILLCLVAQKYKKEEILVCKIVVTSCQCFLYIKPNVHVVPTYLKDANIHNVECQFIMTKSSFCLIALEVIFQNIMILSKCRTKCFVRLIFFVTPSYQ